MNESYCHYREICAQHLVLTLMCSDIANDKQRYKLCGLFKHGRDVSNITDYWTMKKSYFDPDVIRMIL